jgi:SNF2 family DNA or RNA helicase
LTVPSDQVDHWVEELFRLPYLPRLDFPSEMLYEEVRPVPRPQLKIEKASWGGNHRAELSFDYDGAIIPAQRRGASVADADARRRIVRDPAAEQAAVKRMERAGVRHYVDYGRVTYELAPSKLPGIVRALAAEGWRIEAEGKLFRNPGALQMSVSSGIDWFELHGSVEFGDASAQLPQLLAALKKGERTIRLDDGTFGVIPEAWLKKFGFIAGLAQPGEDALRFSKAQAGILDALLEEQADSEVDEQFAQARALLRDFDGIAPVQEPSSFVGRLRAYQREGLGWLHFLERFGFGGCLADDMGLGKTVQVLALLEARRLLRVSPDEGRERPGPSLVVAPRSLVFNWKQEAARFTPQMRVLDHTGAGRLRDPSGFEDFDVVLTTYGTLRRDIFHLKDAQFDYVILDEAQAIKNAVTESAKAARLLRGRRRLALSGTPIENHLGELWSLFEFLNPGMLGSSSVLRLGQGEVRSPDEGVRRLLSRALRPFILRRTKEQVASDLPPKMEQTLYCELEPVQRELYDQLRDHYRRSLLGLVERNGLARSQMQILEALLRLRQAAIHPGLIDSARSAESSAKLEMLLPQLQEVIAEGHKALVFSQFTSMLAILRSRLDQQKTTYEYLDGQTRDRQRAVARFQEDPACMLFLISLRAGGLGLNLTAAEYVFMLDPWWNPAVEAQAIDRTHRIGQTRPVFAYRLIAKDTVEEKVLQLQESKRDLADAILTEDNSVMRSLRREDLELLLS